MRRVVQRVAACAGGGLALAAVAACSDTAPARVQILLYVDTDAHVASELITRKDLSEDAAVDTLRVDLLDGSGQTNTFFVADTASWPVSFGLYPSSSAPLTVRLRLFRALFASSGTANGAAVLNPPPEVAIDRVVSLSWPRSGAESVRVVLSADCMGKLSSFLAPVSTCVDEAQAAASPTTGVEVLAGAPPASTVGTWAPGVDVPCTAQPRAGQRCIPGGFDVMGEAYEVGLTTPNLDPLPYRPVIVSPFLLDTLEVTVGRFRELVLAGRFHGTLPFMATPSNPGQASCTWQGASTAKADALPLNCVEVGTAEAICEAFGGTLPTEAQWNHAARGRGERREFPWGSSDPVCCTESMDRMGPPGCGTISGPEPAGSHPPSRCRGVGDASRDGVIDLGGSMSEAVLDDVASYSDACWTSTHILRDPVCKVPNPIGTIGKGGNWEDSAGLTATPLRTIFITSIAYGFRCAYPDKGP